MTVAKGITSGYMPLSAAMRAGASPTRFPMTPSRDVQLPGTSPGRRRVACAAALANIQIMEKDNLIANAEVMGERLRDGLPASGGKDTHCGRSARPWASRLCRAGRAERLGPPPSTRSWWAQLDRKAWDRGAIVYARGQVVRLAPPLCITRDKVDQLVDIVAASIGELEAELSLDCPAIALAT